MGRWIRRILLACSIGLMVAMVALTIRGIFAFDFFLFDSLAHAFGNDARGLWIYVDMDSGFAKGLGLEAGFSHFRPGEWSWKLPSAYFEPAGTIFVIPHWLVFVIGASYPAFTWLRHRRRKKDVGFAVETIDGPRMDTNVRE